MINHGDSHRDSANLRPPLAKNDTTVLTVSTCCTVPVNTPSGSPRTRDGSTGTVPQLWDYTTRLYSKYGTGTVQYVLSVRYLYMYRKYCTVLYCTEYCTQYYPLPGIIVPLSAGKRGTIIQGGGWYRQDVPFTLLVYSPRLQNIHSPFRCDVGRKANDLSILFCTVGLPDSKSVLPGTVGG